MKRILIVSAASLAAGAIALAAPTAASAATHKIHPHVSATVSHSVIHAKSSVTISGKVSPKAYGHRVYLQWASSTGWRNIGSRVLNYSSRYSFTTKPGGHGIVHYRVYDPAMRGHTRAVSRTLNVTVQIPQSITLRSYSSSSSEWQSPSFYIPVQDYTMSYSLSCAPDDYSPFLSVEWMSGGYQQEYLFATRNGNGAMYGHYGARTGYLDIGTQDDCRWAVKITYSGWK
jgi:hypothetical protein